MWNRTDYFSIIKIGDTMTGRFLNCDKPLKNMKIYYKHNERFTTDNGSHEDVCLVDNVTGKEYTSNFDDIVKLLNELDDEVMRLRSQNTQFKLVLKDIITNLESRSAILKNEAKYLKRTTPLDFNIPRR